MDLPKKYKVYETCGPTRCAHRPKSQETFYNQTCQERRGSKHVRYTPNAVADKILPALPRVSLPSHLKALNKSPRKRLVVVFRVDRQMRVFLRAKRAFPDYRKVVILNFFMLLPLRPHTLSSLLPPLSLWLASPLKKRAPQANFHQLPDNIKRLNVLTIISKICSLNPVKGILYL